MRRLNQALADAGVEIRGCPETVKRIEGALAAGDGDCRDRAEASFRRALEVAARQGATSLELRAAHSLSRLGRSPDAHQLLGEIMGRFTEGHDTADLRAAQTQLALVQTPSND